LPLKLSQEPFSHGLPGSMYRVLAITAILAGQLNDRPCQRIFIVALRRDVSLRPSPLPQQPAGMPLRQPMLLAGMFYRATAPFGA
jgi:hypothetical protein